MLTAEKDRVFLGVAAWLSDKDSALDCCFLFRSVLSKQTQETSRVVSFGVSKQDRLTHVETTRTIFMSGSNGDKQIKTHTFRDTL